MPTGKWEGLFWVAYRWLCLLLPGTAICGWWVCAGLQDPNESQQQLWTGQDRTNKKESILQNSRLTPTSPELQNF